MTRACSSLPQLYGPTAQNSPPWSATWSTPTSIFSEAWAVPLGSSPPSARTSPKGGASISGIGLDGLCDIRWEAALGDDMIGLAELRELARLKQPLVRVRGQWVELRQEDLAAAIAAVGKKGATADHMSAGEVLRTAIGLEQSTDGLPIA